MSCTIYREYSIIPVTTPLGLSNVSTGVHMTPATAVWPQVPESVRYNIDSCTCVQISQATAVWPQVPGSVR